MKINLLGYALLLVCSTSALKSMESTDQHEDMLPPEVLQQNLPPNHPAFGNPINTGDKFRLLCIPKQDTNRAFCERKMIPVDFQKLDFKHIVENIGKIPDLAQASQIVENLLKSPKLKNLTPFVIEMKNEGESDINFNGNKFLDNHKEILNPSAVLDDALKITWTQVSKLLGHFVAIGITFATNAICTSLASKMGTNNQSSDSSAIDFGIVPEAAAQFGIQISSFSAVVFCIRRIAQHFSNRAAHTQIRNSLVPLGSGTDNPPIESGSSRTFLFLVESDKCNEFAQNLSHRNFMTYVNNMTELDVRTNKNSNVPDSVAVDIKD